MKTFSTLPAMRFAWTVIVILSFSFNSFATHIVGGELNYKQIDSTTYEIHLRLYRDCFNGIPPIDSIVNINVFDDSNFFVDTVKIQLTSSNIIDNPNLGICINEYQNVCYEVAEYVDTVVLPISNGSYTLTYQTCCRNSTISNINFPINTGAIYPAFIPDLAVGQTNSNPVFNSLTPTYICVGIPFSFNHSATDLEGDSLVYELIRPYGYISREPFPIHQPPFSQIDWRNGYTTSNMFGTKDSLSLDAETGLLTVTPERLGQFLVGIQVSEYRNGVLLGATSRDYQFNAVVCDKVTDAAFQVAEYNCENIEVEFLNNSSGQVSSYSWDFGDLSTNSDTSVEFQPTYLYNGTGIFYARLIAHSDFNPICDDTTYREVKIQQEYKQIVNYENNPCLLPTRRVDFTCKTQYDDIAGIQYNWDFGDNVGLSQIKAPTYIYKDAGSYEIIVSSYLAANNRCTDTSKISIEVHPDFKIDAEIKDNPCTTEAEFSVSTDLDPQVKTRYFWNFGVDELTSDTSNSASGFYEYSKPGQYSVQLTTCIDSFNCSTISDLQINVDSYQLLASINSDKCSNEIKFSGFSNYDPIEQTTYKWEFGDGNFTNESTGSYQYEYGGIYELVLTGKTSNGCVDSIKYELEKYDFNTAKVANVFTPNSDGINDILYVSGIKEEMDFKIFNRWGRMVYHSKNKFNGWDGNDGGRPSESGTYFYELLQSCGGTVVKKEQGNISLLR